MHRRIFGTLLCTVLLAGCATRGDVEMLQNQAYNDRQQNERSMQQLHDQLNTEIRKSASPMQTKQANTWAELESVRMQMAQLQEQLGTLTMKFDTLTNAKAGQANLTDMAKDIQNIKIALQSQLGIDVDNGTAARKQKAPAAPAPVPAGQNAAARTAPPAKAAAAKTAAKKPHASKYDVATALYSRAEAAYRAKQYDAAMQDFSEYFTTFKKSPKAPDAAFWAGECAYNLKDYGNAILKYQKVIQSYPKSGKYRPAVLRQGMAFFKIKKDQAGRAVLQDLIDRYPKAPESMRARKFLKAHTK